MSDATTPGLLPRLLSGVSTGRALTLGEHNSLHGRAPRADALSMSSLVALLEEAGLRGRGGAGFPAAAKLRAVGRSRRAPVIVVNAVEAEPASRKDRTLLGNAPHLVLDGAQALAGVLGAREVIVCTPESAEWVTGAAAGAIGERGSASSEAPTRVVAIPDAYVGGEETAVVNHLNGGSALPGFKPPYPFERGVGRRPTLVHNAETLAHVALLVRHGVDWFRELGTTQRPGSTLVTLAGAVSAPGVYEISYGMALADLLTHAGGDPPALDALLVGGCGGSWVAGALALRLTLDDESLRQADASLGPGVLVALDQDACGVAETAALARFLADSSARQCGPCRHGLAAIADTVQELRCGSARVDAPQRLHRWLDDVHGRGACRHPDGAVRMIASALSVFEEDFADHAQNGPCTACQRRSTPVTLGAGPTQRIVAGT